MARAHELPVSAAAGRADSIHPPRAHQSAPLAHLFRLARRRVMGRRVTTRDNEVDGRRSDAGWRAARHVFLVFLGETQLRNCRGERVDVRDKVSQRALMASVFVAR